MSDKQFLMGFLRGLFGKTAASPDQTAAAPLPAKGFQLSQARQREADERAKQIVDKAWSKEPSTIAAAVYPVGIVGERSYQPAIKHCRSGEQVTLLHEPDNPYDAEAIAVQSAQGETIGYIAKDSWVREPLLEHRKGCTATIKSISSGEAGYLGVVLNLALAGDKIAERTFTRQ